ncbi:S8 family peptidase [Lacipirellula sp.]|uniref:S8 family peptidase n=1 Tax=Lacipirellula sp. TaxID=2691419 RepID=UPI003D139183
MTRLPHLRPVGFTQRVDYSFPGDGKRAAISLPPRPDRGTHSLQLRKQLVASESDKAGLKAAKEPNFDSDFTVLEFSSEPDFELKLESLERRGEGIELLTSQIDAAGVMRATVRVPDSKLSVFVKLLEEYDSAKRTKKGNPLNQPFVESISAVRLAALPAFWTDDPSSLAETNRAIWWEVWLSGDGNSGVVETFQAEAKRAGLRSDARAIRFPERVVVIAFGTLEQFSQIRGLFDYLAELRRAIEVPTAYIELPARDQGLVIDEALARIQEPAAASPAICILDTGVNREHRLLSLALSAEHTLAVDPAWNSADQDGHGTCMAGIALYGCLTGVFNSFDGVVLAHRLESVKILPDGDDNPPANYGAITAEAVWLAKDASPTRKRVFCMAVTANRCDEGEPSSWSAEIDQLASGVYDGDRHLFIISAGNLRGDLVRDDYPSLNEQEGVEDPAQAWNALTVGAYTDKAHIASEEFDGFAPVAPKGLLCPTSRTTMIWESNDWPFKPDIVLEGGNTAGVEGGGAVSYIEDLALLTTRLAATGVQFTHFCETSAAAALAARIAAIVQSEYDAYWPETIRALMVHSAEWTPEMLDQFPGADRQSKLNRLRCYGYGVPSLGRALWSASNVVTLVAQEALQPYTRVGGAEPIKKDMHFHHLPWPTQMLEDLGDTPISMRVTLSYFVDPSPGRRGWGYKHGYQSFGLRFDVKRPNESQNQFEKRLNKKSWDDPKKQPKGVKETREWELGDQLRTRGSIHSDRWHGTAAQLAASGIIGVYPVDGWWRCRGHLDRWGNLARYALVVTIETPDVETDLYTPIANEIETEVRAMLADVEIEIDGEEE